MTCGLAGDMPALPKCKTWVEGLLATWMAMHLTDVGMCRLLVHWRLLNFLWFVSVREVPSFDASGGRFRS